MLWGGLDFIPLLETNKNKYLNEWATLPKPTFETIIELLENFSAEFFELLDEVDNHKEITLLRIKTLIDDRTKIIIQEA